MNKKQIKEKLGQMDDVYVYGYQGDIIGREELVTTLNEILLESVPPKIRDYYNWILQGVTENGKAAEEGF